MDEYVYVWPTGAFCFRHELEHYLIVMNDNYEAVPADEFFSEDES